MNSKLEGLLRKCTGFEWDEGNTEKNWERHQVSNREAEQVFFNQPRILGEDKKHSQSESRYGCYGRTNKDRTLFIVFTIRQHRIRVISARDQNRQEREVYAKTHKAVA